MKRLDRDNLAEYQKNSRKSPMLYKNYLNPNQGYSAANFTPLREQAEYGGFTEGLPQGQLEAQQAVVDKWRDTLPQDMQGKSLTEMVDWVRGNANMYSDYNNPANMASLRQSIEDNFNQRNHAAAQKYNQPPVSQVPANQSSTSSYQTDYSRDKWDTYTPKEKAWYNYNNLKLLHDRYKDNPNFKNDYRAQGVSSLMRQMLGLNNNNPLDIPRAQLYDKRFMSPYGINYWEKPSTNDGSAYGFDLMRQFG